jgi:hypothetical protein
VLWDFRLRVIRVRRGTEGLRWRAVSDGNGDRSRAITGRKYQRSKIIQCQRLRQRIASKLTCNPTATVLDTTSNRGVLDGGSRKTGR